MNRRIYLCVMGVLGLLSLSGCVSLEEYDQWRNDIYKADGKELERFEELAAAYGYGIHFEAVSDEAVIRGVTGTGRVENGVYRFAHEAESEYAHFDIDIGYLQGQTGDNLQRLAFLVNARNHANGFVEVFPGGNIDGGGEHNPTTSEAGSGLTNGDWTLVEFIRDGSGTIVKGSAYERTMDGRLESLSVFCFHGASVEIDYILFE